MSAFLQKLRESAGSLGMTANLGLKGASLVLAIFLWVLLATQEKSERVLEAPLNLNLPTGLTLTTAPPDTATVRLRGGRAALTRVSPGDVRVAVDLTRAQQGRQIVLLGEQNVEVPFGLEFAGVSPSQLDLELVAIVEQKVPIQPNLAGEVPPGHTVVGTTVEPAEARVRGPENLFREEIAVSTQAVTLGGRRNSFTTTVRVLSPLPDVEILSPEEARVRVEIVERTTQRTLTVTVETTGRANGRIQINPSQLSVTLEGPTSQIQALQAADLLVQLEVEGLEPQDEDYHLAPAVRLRRKEAFPGVTIQELGQPRIDVHVYPVSGD